MKRRSIIFILIIALCAFSAACSQNTEEAADRALVTATSRPSDKLREAYNYAKCSWPWANYGLDWSYISIDTNPYDVDNSTTYYSDAKSAIQSIHRKLGLPSSLWENMTQTSALMGRQSKTYDSIGIEVSWTYHPDKGLNVIYEAIVK